MKKDDPFLVHLDEVPKAGRETELELPEDWTASVLGSAYDATEMPSTIAWRARRDGDNLLVDGEVALTARYDCSRCGVAVQKRFTCPVHTVFVPQERHRIHLQELEQQDKEVEEMYGYEARTFSIEQPFVDAVALTLDPYPVCGDACPGPQDAAPDAPPADDDSRDNARTDPRWAALARLKKKLEDK